MFLFVFVFCVCIFGWGRHRESEIVFVCTVAIVCSFAGSPSLQTSLMHVTHTWFHIQHIMCGCNNYHTYYMCTYLQISADISHACNSHMIPYSNIRTHITNICTCISICTCICIYIFLIYHTYINMYIYIHIFHIYTHT